MGRLKCRVWGGRGRGKIRETKAQPDAPGIRNFLKRPENIPGLYINQKFRHGIEFIPFEPVRCLSNPTLPKSQRAISVEIHRG